MTPMPKLPAFTLPDEDDAGGIKLSPEVWNQMKATLYIVTNYINMNTLRCGVIAPKNPPPKKPVFDGQVQ
jgi:hypothetical protein